MTGKARLADETGVVPRTELGDFFGRRSGFDLVFMLMLPVSTKREFGAPPPKRRDESAALRWLVDVEFTREPLHEPGRFYHEPLCAGNFMFEALGIAPGLLFQ